MRKSVKAAILLTSCFLLTAGACQPTRIAVPSRPDLANPARLICEGVPARPALPSAYAIDWAKVQTVEQAKGEHDAYVRSINARNGVVAAHVVELEGRLFVCSNNAQWWRDYWSELPDR